MVIILEMSRQIKRWVTGHPILKQGLIQKAILQAELRKPLVVHACKASPGGPESAEKVGDFGVLVAIQDVQPLPAHERSHLADSRLARSCLAHQQHRLRILKAPAQQNNTSCIQNSAACFSAGCDMCLVCSK
jgi:hypothetical protein